MRNGTKPVADVNVGLADAEAVIYSNRAMDENRRVFWPEDVIALFLLVCALLAPAPELRYEASRQSMGCTYTIVAYGSSESLLRSATDAAFDEIDRLDAFLSNFKPNSELSQVNREAGLRAVRVTPELFRFLEISDDFRRETWGAFTITLGKGKMRLDAQGQTVELSPNGVKLDPGGIGKGFAVDRAVEVLKAAGIERALVDAGSSTIYAMGSPPGEKGWKVAVWSPESKNKIVASVLLKDSSLSTSATYEQGSHIIDPRTHRPPTGVRSASSVAPAGTASDALSTAFFVLGLRGTARYLRAHPGVRAFLCAPDCRWVQ